MEKPHGIYREYKHGYLGCMSNKTPEELMSIKKGYLCAVKMIDIEVGRVIEALKKKDIFNNTVIIFVSDHGDMLGDHELMAKGAFFYDACTKVPLIMSYPAKFSNGIECDSLVQPSDIASTLLEAAGCKIEEINSLMPHSINLIKSTHNSVRDVCICSYKNTGISDDKTYHNPPINATMLRDKDFKLNVYHGELKGELYDMHNDKNEINNLWDIPEYSEVKLRLLNKLLDTVIDYDIAYNSGKGGSGESVASNLL